MTPDVHLRTAIDRQLSGMAVDVDETKTSTTYKIWPWRISMWAAFSEVTLTRNDTRWLLRLKVSRVYLLFFPAFLFFVGATDLVYGTFRTVDLVIALAVPAALIGISVITCSMAIRLWWSML